MFRYALTVLGLAAISVTGCLSTDSAAEPDGPALAINVSPLSLPGIVDACYDLTVTNGPGGGGDTVFARTGICSAQFGDGAGSLAFVGTCDADAAGDNSVSLVLTSISDASGPAEVINPCPPSSPCTKDVTCVANQDAFVGFQLTVMRPASQGFFDIAVTFDDVYCSAKVDCSDDDAGTEPLPLLFEPGSSTRVPTAVMALACTAGAGSGTELFMSNVLVDCGATQTAIPLTQPAGNIYTVASPAPAPLLQAATYRGVEQLTDGGQPLDKLYFNTALALDFDAVPAGGCNLTATLTATSSGGFDAHPFETPPGAYPIINVDVPLAATTGQTTYSCAKHPLGDGPEDGVWSSYTALTTPQTFTARAIPQGATVEVEGAAPAETYVVLNGTGILYSTDATSWNAANVPTSDTLHHLELSGGTFVAAGSAGVVLYSTDGINWTQTTSGTTSTFQSMDSQDGVFLAGASSASGRTVHWSDDGINWQQVLSTAPYTPYAQISRGRYYAGRWDGSCPCSGRMYRGANSVPAAPGSMSTFMSWTSSAVPYSVAEDASGGFVYIGAHNGIHRANSTNGTGFTLHALSGTQVFSLTDDGHPTTATMVGFGSSDGTTAYVSTDDGVTWQTIATGVGLAAATRVYHDGTQFIANAGSALISSPDGLNWTQFGSAPSAARDIAIKPAE